MAVHGDVQCCGTVHPINAGERMRSNIICSLAAALAVFAQFSAIFATFSQPVVPIARQPAHIAATELVVEARQAI
jgi:hypothetical protein